MQRHVKISFLLLSLAPCWLAAQQVTPEDRVNQASELLGLPKAPAAPAPAPVTPPPLTAPPTSPAIPAPPATAPAPAATAASTSLEDEAFEILRRTKAPPHAVPPPSAKSPSARTTITRWENQRRNHQDTRARARGNARTPAFFFEPAPEQPAPPPAQPNADAKRQEEITQIEAEILKLGRARAEAAAAAPAAPQTPPPATPASPAIPEPTPPPLANTPVTVPAAVPSFTPAPPRPSSLTDLDQRVRDVLERKMAELYGAKPPAPAFAAPAPVLAAPPVAPPVTAPPPAVAPPSAAAPPPAAVNAYSAPVRPEPSEPVNVRMVRGSATTQPAAASEPAPSAAPTPPPSSPRDAAEALRLAEEEARLRAQQQAGAQSIPAGQLTAERQKAATTKLKSKNARVPGTSLIKTKEDRLADLLDSYRKDLISPIEYHKERAKILAEP